MWLYQLWRDLIIVIRTQALNNISSPACLFLTQRTIGEWVRCQQGNLNYTRTVTSSIPYHANLSMKGYRSLIYRFNTCKLHIHKRVCTFHLLKLDITKQLRYLISILRNKARIGAFTLFLASLKSNILKLVKARLLNVFKL